jgi:hypothetical protein
MTLKYLHFDYVKISLYLKFMRIDIYLLKKIIHNRDFYKIENFIRHYVSLFKRQIKFFNKKKKFYI